MGHCRRGLGRRPFQRAECHLRVQPGIPPATAAAVVHARTPADGGRRASGLRDRWPAGVRREGAPGPGAQSPSAGPPAPATVTLTHTLSLSFSVSLCLSLCLSVSLLSLCLSVSLCLLSLSLSLSLLSLSLSLCFSVSLSLLYLSVTLSPLSLSISPSLPLSPSLSLSLSASLSLLYRRDGRSRPEGPRARDPRATSAAGRATSSRPGRATGSLAPDRVAFRGRLNADSLGRDWLQAGEGLRPNSPRQVSAPFEFARTPARQRDLKYLRFHCQTSCKPLGEHPLTVRPAGSADRRRPAASRAPSHSESLRVARRPPRGASGGGAARRQTLKAVLARWMR